MQKPTYAKLKRTAICQYICAYPLDSIGNTHTDIGDTIDCSLYAAVGGQLSTMADWDQSHLSDVMQYAMQCTSYHITLLFL